MESGWQNRGRIYGKTFKVLIGNFEATDGEHKINYYWKIYILGYLYFTDILNLELISLRVRQLFK